MSDQPQQPVFTIEKVYVKDLSLELPHAPQVFLESQAPQVDVQIGSSANPVQEGLYECVITLTVTAKVADKTYFLVEVAQAGIFQIRNVPQSDLDPILGIACPNILFPYGREVVADLISRGGFPPVHLAPINFEAVYAQRVQEQSRAAGPKIEIAH
jgi:preprotein translocase subunit SecB